MNDCMLMVKINIIYIIYNIYNIKKLFLKNCILGVDKS